MKKLFFLLFTSAALVFPAIAISRMTGNGPPATGGALDGLAAANGVLYALSAASGVLAAMLVALAVYVWRTRNATQRALAAQKQAQDEFANRLKAEGARFETRIEALETKLQAQGGPDLSFEAALLPVYDDLELLGRLVGALDTRMGRVERSKGAARARGSDTPNPARQAGTKDTAKPDTARGRTALSGPRHELYSHPVIRLADGVHCALALFARIRQAQAHGTGGDDTQATDPALAAPAIFDRIVRFVDVIAARHPDLQIYGDLPSSALYEANEFAQLLDLLGGQAAEQIADRLRPEICESDLARLDGPGQARLHRLREAGYRLSLRVAREPVAGGRLLQARDLARAGFCAVKVDISVLSDAMQGGLGDIHAADLNQFLERENIDLIASNIEERAQIDLLASLDIRFAQGPLFSRPPGG